MASIDVDRDALAVAWANFPHPHLARNLVSLSTEELLSFEADLWWMSPPCQPFTRRGSGRDDEDPRTESLLALIDRLGEARPDALALENVPEFLGSRTHGRLLESLSALGYAVDERILCPTELGVPNRRRRYYLTASRGGLPVSTPRSRPSSPLSSFLEESADRDPRLRVDEELLARYERAVDRIDPADPAAVASTFTSAYGRSPVRSGSYVRCADGGWRRFSPREILRLLGFPDTYRLPESLPLRRAWHLVGNSLSVPAVREVLGSWGPEVLGS